MTLTPSEAGKVLFAASTIDNRQYDETTATSWAALILAPIDLATALAAVADHYTKTRAWLMPSDINDFYAARRVVELARLRDAGPPDYPSGLTQPQERAYREIWQGHVKRGLTGQQATAETDTELRYHRAELVDVAEQLRQIVRAS